MLEQPVELRQSKVVSSPIYSDPQLPLLQLRYSWQYFYFHYFNVILQMESSWIAQKDYHHRGFQE